ncbi:PhnD/SsuA/transferrin family substrate-binding protein [Pseudomonas sp. W22_MBD1_FP4]|uniref:ABC transporter substrate-binding protein n=1 Tax=Pseudomonas sp. W22_MBD1_FP4 TaxID=3240272 RepID=UPI003F9D37F8
MNLPYKRLIATLALALSPLLTAWAADTPDRVRIGIVSFTQGGKPVFGGIPGRVIEEGWLEQELKKRGVALEWQALPHANAGPQINEGFSNNGMDFAVRGDLPSVIALAGGVTGKLVVPGGSGNNIYLVVPKDSPAHTIEDLKGKRLALHRGRPWEFAFSEFLASKGLALKDFKIANINPQVGAAAVSAGKVDAAVLLSEAYLLEDKQVGRVLWSSKQGDTDWRLVSDLWGTERFVDGQPQLTQLVATAWVKASQWLADEHNADEYYRFSSLAGTPQSVLRRDDQGDPVPWAQRWAPKTDAQLLKHFAALSQYALNNQLISTQPDLSQSLATRFTNQAIRDLGLVDLWPNLKAQVESAR